MKSTPVVLDTTTKPLNKKNDSEVPAYIQEAVKKRIEDSKTQSINVITNFPLNPLNVEPDKKRLQERLDRISNSPSGAKGQERIQGDTVDFFGVSFLDLARMATRSVGRVILANGSPNGSGFMVSEKLFLTNNHVISSIADADRFLLEFDYELDFEGKAKTVTRFKFDPITFFYTNTETDLDFTLIAVGDRTSGTAMLKDFTYCPLFKDEDKHVLGEFVNIIQHPAGDFKQIVFRENQLVNRLSKVLHYLADTMPGSSGSPVFNDQWEVIALHHWGEPFREVTDADGQPIPKEMNEGIRISAIFDELTNLLSKLTGEQRQLLQNVLKFKSRYPIFIEQLPPREPDNDNMELLNGNGAQRKLEQLIEENEPLKTTVISNSADNDLQDLVTIPFEIAIRMGKAKVPTSASLQEPTLVNGNNLPINIQDTIPLPIKEDEQSSNGSEGVKIDKNYNNRNGYNPRFLSGFAISLPALNDAQLALAARKINTPGGENPFELKYQHFSIVMNAARRIAYFTAANIDGSTWIAINRKTGQPGGESAEVLDLDNEASEASEKWYNDPRILLNAQLEQPHFDRQQPRVFDRGHLVRRQDPTWGTKTRAVRANADTFHFTNCSHQQWNFNQSAQYWQGIENFILNSAKADKEKVTVVTGPVLKEDDPSFRNVLQIPMQFYKIVAFSENGDLKAFALLASQSDKIRRMPENFGEAFDDLDPVQEFQTSIVEIERLTGLDFGILRDHDTFRAAGPEGIMKPLTDFADIML